MNYISDFLKTAGISFVVLMYALYVVLVSPGVYELTFLFTLIPLTVNVKRYWDSTALLLLLFSLTYAIIKFAYGELQSVFGAFTVMVGPSILYIYGKYISENFKKESFTPVFWLFVSVAVATLLYKEVIIDIINNGFIKPMRILPISTNSGEEFEMAATLYGVNVSLGFAGLTFLLVRNKSLNIIILSSFLVLSILSLLTVAHLVTRTGMVLAAVVLAITSVYQSKNKIFRFLAIIIVLIGFFFLLIEFNVIGDDLIQAYSNRQSGSFDSDIGGDRLWRWLESIPRLFIYPLGWDNLHITKYLYVHNLWLDIAMDVGVVPFVLLLIVTIRTIKESMGLFKIKNDPNIALLISLALVFFLTCMVEPIMNGARYYFYLYCLFMGYQKGYLYKVCYFKNFARI